MTCLYKTGTNCCIHHPAATRNIWPDQFFNNLTNRQIRILTAFRTRNQRFCIEVVRWKSREKNERLCQLCNKDLGDKFHFLFQREKFKNKRKLYIKPLYLRCPNTLKYSQLINTKNKTELRKLCTFIDYLLDDVKVHYWDF